MSIYTDELEAEKAVNRSLLNELKRRQSVSHYLKLDGGQLILTDHYTEVTKEDVQTTIEQMRSEASQLEDLIAEPAPEVPETPEPTPETPPTPSPEPEAPVEEVPTPPVAETIEVNGEDVPANADGTINIDVTPEAEQPPVAEVETPAAPVAEAPEAAPTPPTPQPAQTATPVVLQ